MLLTTYQRMQAIRLRLVREELRGRDAELSHQALDHVEDDWQLEDRLRFLTRDPDAADRRHPPAPTIDWRDM